MNYPFSAEQFIEVINKYNVNVCPMQIVFYLIGIVLIILLFRTDRNYSKIISSILAGFWLWMGIVYHLIFFTVINPAAYLFGSFFVLQGLLILYYGVIKNKLEFKFDKSVPTYFGIFLILIALVIYPVLGYYMGHTYPNNPTFGLPCPTTIFTLGVMLMGISIPKKLFAIPILWSLIGFMAAISFGIKEDVLLLVSGIISLIFIIFRKKFHVYGRN